MVKLGTNLWLWDFRLPSLNLHALLSTCLLLCPSRASAPCPTEKHPPRDHWFKTQRAGHPTGFTSQLLACKGQWPPWKRSLCLWTYSTINRTGMTSGVESGFYLMSPTAGCQPTRGQPRAATFQSSRPGQATNVWTQPLHNLLKSHTVFPEPWPEAKIHTFQFLRL